jgi:hypothetical protein
MPASPSASASVEWSQCHPYSTGLHDESPSLVLVINDTKLLMPCVKCFELGISNTCDEGVCGKEWWPQDHKEMVHGHEMMIMVEMHIKGRTWWSSEREGSKSARQRYNHRGFSFAGLRWVEKWLTGFRIHSRLWRGAITVSLEIKCH